MANKQKLLKLNGHPPEMDTPESVDCHFASPVFDTFQNQKEKKKKNFFPEDMDKNSFKKWGLCLKKKIA